MRYDRPNRHEPRPRPPIRRGSVRRHRRGMYIDDSPSVTTGVVVRGKGAGLLLTIIGAIIIVVAFGLLFGYCIKIVKMKDWAETTGEVVEVKVSVSYDDDGYESYTYSPIVEFEVGDREYFYSSNVYTSKFYYEDQEVTVYYNINNPQDNSLTFTNKALMWASIAVGVIGVVLLNLGLAEFIKKKRTSVSTYCAIR